MSKRSRLDRPVESEAVRSALLCQPGMWVTECRYDTRLHRWAFREVAYADMQSLVEDIRYIEQPVVLVAGRVRAMTGKIIYANPSAVDVFGVMQSESVTATEREAHRVSSDRAYSQGYGWGNDDDWDDELRWDGRHGYAPSSIASRATVLG